MMRHLLLLCLLFPVFAYAQTSDTTINKAELDSLYIIEIEEIHEPDKVLHAEPLFIDLIRDLGARKGEKEWNVGLGLTDQLNYDKYTALIEYEWAPVNRLGLEVELPFTFYAKQPVPSNPIDLPGDKLDGIKTAIQYTFYVSAKTNTSMALGYINEVMLKPFNNMKSGRVVEGNSFNPFFIAAKRWGNNFHTLLYTGPVVERFYGTKETHSHFQVNSNFHYMISGTRNFIGVEVNQEVEHGKWNTVVRPQMRLGIMDNLMVGIVAGIPVSRQNERLSSFARLIYEPGHHTTPKKYRHARRVPFH
ncbi:HAEPLYID family protein [Aridibaculum aurantiacum]|uniref:HAEPLYID family protein n=1 Tax=Aridibaculum aurantiacum TaxID=2810307 RepID=UPI001A96514C|nr:HAEPLYID family protein [Aridibaculum aurantiacum]